MNTDGTAVGDTSLTERIIKAAFQVSITLGCGFLEKVHESALALELKFEGFEVEQQKETPVHYRGELVGMYQADLVVNEAVIVELKVARSLEAVHRAQCMNCLRASGKSLGLLINFGTPRNDVQRIQFS